MLKFNDYPGWLKDRIKGVQRSYPTMIGDVAVDIGANVGAFPIVFCNRYNRIICIEPSKYSFMECISNTKYMDNVEVHKYAVGSESGQKVKLQAYKGDNYSGNASTLVSDYWNSGKYEKVETICLEDIFIRFNLKRINYLKVDCEGAEYDFLMNKDLSKIDYLAIEIHLQLKEKAGHLKEYLDKYFTLLTCKDEDHELKFYKNDTI